MSNQNNGYATNEQGVGSETTMYTNENDTIGTPTEPEAVPASSNDLRGISINPLSSGYMVKVGCQSVAVETTEKLIDMLNKYLTDPVDFERKWYSKTVRNRLDNIS